MPYFVVAPRLRSVLSTQSPRLLAFQTPDLYLGLIPMIRWLMGRRAKEERERSEAYIRMLDREIAEELARTPGDTIRADLLHQARERNHVVESLVLGFKMRGHA